MGPVRSAWSDKAVIRVVAVPLFLTLLLVVTIDMVRVAGPSMEPGIISGERVLVLRLAYGFRVPGRDGYAVHWRVPERGDIVLVVDPVDGFPVVKRCVGMPGDRVSVNSQRIRIGNKTYPVDEAIYPGIADYTRVPPGRYFLVGDNTTQSVDSRHYGPIKFDAVLGRVLR